MEKENAKKTSNPIIDFGTQYVDERQVSAITGRGIQTLRNDRHLGRGIPYTKLSRSVRYNVKDVFDFMEGRKIHTEN
jgi:hypothetical protein